MKKECKLIIQDEVNVKIDGLDPVVRRKLVSSLKYEIPGARFMPSVKMGRWDGKQSFCTIGGNTYINLLDVVLPIIEEAGYSFTEVQDLRIEHNIKFPKVDKNLFDGKVWAKGHDLEGQPIELWDHQVECINNFLENLQCVQEISTGAGKTILAAALSYLVEKHTGGRTIVIVPNKDLIRQTQLDYVNVGLDVGVYYGDRKDIGNQHTICTWQSLNNLEKLGEIDDLNVLQAFLDQVNCVVVDECFDGETLIKTSKGKKKIKNIEVGDSIINYCETTKTFKEDTVVDTYRNISINEEMYELEFDNKVNIKVTGNHKFLTINRGWVRADDLTECDNIVDYDLIEVEYFNTNLEQANQSIRVIYFNKYQIWLNNGFILDSESEIRKFKRRMDQVGWIEYYDKLYGTDRKTAKIIEEKIKANKASLGGKAVQEIHGDSIRKNLNTGIPWNKGKKGIQVSWNKGLTKHDHPGLMASSMKQTGEGNPMFGVSPSIESRNKQSRRMKEKILDGTFTPAIKNSQTRKNIKFRDKLYRSSWEAMFAQLNPEFEYEVIRLPYYCNGKRHIYIVDFVCHEKKKLIEVKPKTHQDKKFDEKKKTAQEWAQENGYEYLILDEEYFYKKHTKLNIEEFDSNTQRKIHALFKRCEYNFNNYNSVYGNLNIKEIEKIDETNQKN